MDSATGSASAKTPTESDVYDRQIRLWGAEAQKKMQSSKVLYINVTGVTSEIIKNLVLAGIAATICDNRPAVCLNQSPCFFTPTHVSDPTSSTDDSATQSSSDNTASTSEPAPKKAKAESVAQAVQPLIEELNPLLGSCPVLTKNVSEITSEDLAEFTIVVASKIPLNDAVRLSELIKQSSSASSTTPPAFFLVDCFGMNGAAIIDVGPNYQFRPEQGKKLLNPIGLKDGYVSFSDIVSVPLSDCINRFHKKGPPPTWVLYRSLLQVQVQLGRWIGDDDDKNDGDDSGETLSTKARKVVETYLKDENVTNVTDEQINQTVAAGMAQIAPVCAVLGGVVGNEVIKVISGKGEPANNTLLLDGDECKTWTFMVKPKATTDNK